MWNKIYNKNRKNEKKKNKKKKEKKNKLKKKNMYISQQEKWCEK